MSKRRRRAKKRRGLRLLLWIVLLLAVVAVASPSALRAFWAHRSDNPVRAGITRARELGCFSCHGELGRKGIAEPANPALELPGWSGGVWMMYVSSDEEVRGYILHGSDFKYPGTGDDDPLAGLRMPGYKDLLRGDDLDNLVAAFKVLSEMAQPPQGSAARRGVRLANKLGCVSCHGPGGSGGLDNPRSLAGFIPGWYGPDFEDLVRSREEFDGWIRQGSIPRLERNPLASFFTNRQQVRMPAYPTLRAEELDDLWAYVSWLGETSGGWRNVPPAY